MHKIKHVFRLTIIENDKKKVNKLFTIYNKAFAFCGDYFIQKYDGLSWGRRLKEVIKYSDVKNSNKYKETVFVKEGFTKKITKKFQIFIDEIYEGTEKKYPAGKNMHTKHHFEVKSPENLLEFNSMSYKKGYYKVGKYLFQRLPNSHWSYGLNYLQDGYDKTPLFIKGKMNYKIQQTKISIMPM